MDQYITNIDKSYDNVSLDKYVIMPNHVHMIVTVSGVPSHTISISRIVHAFKSLSSKEAGCSLWQQSFHDHIIRHEQTYQQIWRYIDTNPQKWAEDCYYTIETPHPITCP